VETQSGRKPQLSLYISSSFIIGENLLQYCTVAKSYRYVGSNLQKATTFSHSPTPTGRELQTPNLIY